MDGSGFPGREAIDLTPPVSLQADDFAWPDCPAPPPPPSPPPLPVPVLRTMDPNALEVSCFRCRSPLVQLVLDLVLLGDAEARQTDEGILDDDVHDEILEQIHRAARATSLRASQAHDFYPGVPDEYIDWEAFVPPYVCRVRGCRFYGLDFRVRVAHMINTPGETPEASLTPSPQDTTVPETSVPLSSPEVSLFDEEIPETPQWGSITASDEDKDMSIIVL
ncbi:uncharacterized protein B0H64DRAFT_377326 [Chaetomium fimeti]|uniref:Uncharacterized protein n=1 Tax=Chaetomium fimeti TaxID=1854472 RepID=A0AAE0H868_9PEZI|nr:hypothetical protein B0H64DRAFT_377326 [Chaetomium fimeti]